MLRWLTAVFGPIFAKEMIELARRPRYYLLRVVYCGILLFFVYTAFTNVSPPPSIAKMSDIANDVFISVMVIQFFTVALVVPAMLGGSIAGERAAGSLDLLRISTLSDREILLGKLASRLGAVFLLVLSALPVLALAGLWGGIDLESLLLGQLSVIEAMAFAGSLAMYFSARAPVALGAIVQTYVWLGLLCFAQIPLILVITEAGIAPLLGVSRRSAENFVLVAEVLFNPLMGFFVAIEPHARYVVTSWFGQYYWLYSGLFVFCVSAMFLHRAHIHLQRGSEPVSKKGLFRKLQWAAMRRRQRRPIGAFWQRLPIELQNPLARRGQDALAYDRGHYLFRAQWGAIAFAVLMLVISGLADLEPIHSMLLFTLGTGWCLLMLPLGLLGSWSFFGDRKSGFLEMVLSTPLEGQTIVDGTFISLWWHLWPGMFFLLGIAIVSVPFTFSVSGLALCVTGFLFGSIVLMLGMMCALVAKNFATGASATLTFASLFGGVLPLYLLSKQYDSESVEILSAILVPVGILALRIPPTCWSFLLAMAGMYLGPAYLTNYWNDTFRFLEEYASYPGCILFPVTWMDLLMSTTTSGKVWKYQGLGPWWASLGFYWLAMLLTIAWARWWLIRHFDRLAGRTLARPDGMPRQKEMCMTTRCVPGSATPP